MANSGENRAKPSEDTKEAQLRTGITKDDGVALAEDKFVTLDVGGRKFRTLRANLLEGSGYFDKLFSWQGSTDLQSDGSYFVDADPDLFEHLLRYLRRPGAYPLFWDKTKGFDYDLYNKLQIEADYFWMDKLSAWIKDKGYLKAIRSETTTTGRRELKYDETSTSTGQGDVNIQHHICRKTVQVYICPRGIAEHRDNRSACGKKCRSVEGEPEYVGEQRLYVTESRKTITFKPEALGT